MKTWELMRELVKDMSVFNTFLYGNDFHNLKAAIKKVYTSSDLEGIFMPIGTVEPELLIKAAREHDFALIPEYMRECAEEAYQVLFHTGDSQLCEVIIDKAALQTIYKHGMQSGNELLAAYAELKTAFADINIIVRCIRTGKDEGFMKRALAECESLDIDRLAYAAVNEGFEGVLAYLEETAYADAVMQLRTSMSAFECWCDNRIIELIKPQKYNPFTLSPLAAYILARDNEIKTVRILLSGKRNEIPDSAIRERLRDMYV
jgi:V/A-type H+-transporting ATPase subunit C